MLSFLLAHTFLYLLHSGILSAVGDLRASSNASSVTISWTAPFSLDVTGVDPDIWYSVLIYNVTDENNPTTITVNTTDTYYIFTPDYISPCHKFLFSVIPFNGAGQGESSTSEDNEGFVCSEMVDSSPDPKTDPLTSTVIDRIQNGTEGKEISLICEKPFDFFVTQGSQKKEYLSSEEKIALSVTAFIIAVIVIAVIVAPVIILARQRCGKRNFTQVRKPLYVLNTLTYQLCVGK